MRESTIEIIENYFSCLKEKTLEKAPFAADIEFDAPTAGPFSGRDAVLAFFGQATQFIVQAHPKQFVVDGEHAVVIMDLETVAGMIPVAEVFHVVNGEIKSIRPYYDPRPLVG